MRRLIIFLVLVLSGCIDRIVFDVDAPATFPLAVEGFISTEPGPYTIKLSKAFDIESKQSIKTPISVKRVVLADDAGNSELLTQVADGEYQTNPTGIQGVVGRAYTLEIETLDGRVYRSNPDPLLPAGSVTEIYHQYKAEKNNEGETEYGFDVYFNSTSGSQDNYYFLWKFVGTFQVETNPELYTVPCGESRCPAPLPCSAYVLEFGQLVYSQPCECCTCWSKFFNDEPVISDNQVIKDGSFVGVKIGYVPITQWTFMHKVHAEVQQFSLSPQAFAFWKSIKDQKQAIGSLFAPQAGKIPTNFVQLSGPKSPIEGLFYATAISKSSIYITRNDVPNPGVIPEVNPLFTDNCERLFPNTTSVKPDFWED